MHYDDQRQTGRILDELAGKWCITSRLRKLDMDRFEMRTLRSCGDLFALLSSRVKQIERQFFLLV